MPELSDPGRTGLSVSPVGDPAPSAPGLQSPSLYDPTATDAATAYEVKFLLTEEQARLVAGYVAGRLAPDPHADPALGGAYPTTSVYTDTPAFDVFRRTEGYDRDKFRVRRYGADGPVFVERKTKNGDKVRKHRARIDPTDLVGLTRPAADGAWAGGWFHGELLERRLGPVCRVAYERVAFLGTADGGTVRLTLDRNIRGVPGGEWAVEAVGAVPPLLPDRVVCEFKFRTAMPALFRNLVADLALAPAPFSKYRAFVRAAGIVPAGTPEGAADA